MKIGVREVSAVITGDVVQSSAMDPPQRAALPELLRAFYGELQAKQPSSLLYPIDVFSGDSWQVYVPDPVPALAVAIYLRARLMERQDLRTRLALAIDEVEFLKPNSISESDGPAFKRSGRALSQMDRSVLFQLLIPEWLEHAAPIRLAAESIADLTDHLVLSWTRAQAQAIAHMLAHYPDEPRQKDVARAWRPRPISQPGVNKHLRNAGWDLLHRALVRYEALVQAMAETVEVS